MSDFTPLEELEKDPHLITVEEKAPSWAHTFGWSFTQLMLALALFVMAFALLYWNENKTLLETLRLSEGSKLVVSLPSDQPDSDNNGQLVHVSGVVSTKDVLSDELFYLSANVIALNRIVEMYQWQEEGPQDGEAGAVSYSKVWSKQPIVSSKFRQPQGHSNPKMELSSSSYVAENVFLGGFVLSDSFIAQLSGVEDYPLVEDDYVKINPDMSSFKLYRGMYYRGANPETPEIGDIRVRYTALKHGQTVSVVGMQNVDRIETFNTDYSAIKLLAPGVIDADTMLRQEVKARPVSDIWWLRFAGWSVMLVSIWMALGSFVVLHHIMPFVSGLVGYNKFEMSFFVSLAQALLTVAVAWVNYQAAFGLGLIVVSCSLMISTAFLQKESEKRAKKRKRSRKEEPEEESFNDFAPLEISESPASSDANDGMIAIDLDEEDKRPEQISDDVPVDVPEEAAPKKLPVKFRFLKKENPEG